MGWNKKYKLVATSKYIDKRTGEEKKQFTTIGHELENERGSRLIKIDVTPVGWDGWCSKFDLDDRQQSQVQQDRQTVEKYQPIQEAAQVEFDDLPFWLLH